MKKTKIISIILAAVMLLSIIPAATLTSYAADAHTVTFDGNGNGGTILTLTVPEGWNIDDTLDELPYDQGWDILFPDVPTDSELIYDWYSDPACDEGDWFDFDDEITEDITLYAKWLPVLESIDVTLTVPKCGETTELPGYPDEYWDWDDQTNRPGYTLPEDLAYAYDFDEITGKYFGWWLIYEDGTYDPIVGTFEGGKEYPAYIYLYPEDEYLLYSGTKLVVNGGLLSASLLEDESDKYYAEYIVNVKVEHDWGEWTVTKEPTKTETGLKERICAQCGEKETEVIPALGDNSASKPASPPTGDGSHITVCLASLAFASLVMAAAFVRKSRSEK